MCTHIRGHTRAVPSHWCASNSACRGQWNLAVLLNECLTGGLWRQPAGEAALNRAAFSNTHRPLMASVLSLCSPHFFLSFFLFSLRLSLCLLPPCHAPLSNLFSLCVSCLFSGIFLSFLASSSFSRRALSSLPLQSCEKVGTVTSVCGSFESLLSICFSSIKLPFVFVFVCLGCFMWGAEGLNLPVQLLLWDLVYPAFFFLLPVSACVFAVSCFFFVVFFPVSIFCDSVHKKFNGAHLKTPWIKHFDITCALAVLYHTVWML